ncbi:MAG: hypothetical protein FVQ81_12465 [Candidatus Glassbacteria bacterium]|nr:hypothetical protein [Candidatus Glassbacteria bacterium]
MLPASPSPLADAPGVFFYEQCDTIADLQSRWQNVGDDDGNFALSTADALSGGRSLRQKYRPLSEYGEGEDPGSAGWVGRFFGDKTSHQSSIPPEQQGKYTTAVASWYHKFEEGFTPRDGWHFPPKMARMRCYLAGNWNTKYSILFWFAGEDAHMSIERHTYISEAHREWPPNHTAPFRLSNPLNVGRWIHFELRVELGDGPRSDRVQAWADGLLVCDIAGDDIAAGHRETTLNCMQWDCYWNGGSPVAQSRFFDDMVVSTERIGPLRAGLNPKIVKTPFSGGGDSQGGWEAELAQGVQRELVKDKVLDGIVIGYREPEVDYTTVWRGALEGGGNELEVSVANGEFTGPRAGEGGLAANTLHFVRVRQKNTAGEWSDWSAWHSGFATAWPEGTPAEQKSLPEGYLAEAGAAVLGLDETPPEIRYVRGPSSVADTAGPYGVTAEIIEENPLNVYLYYRFDGQGEYERVPMTREAGNTFAAGLPGRPAGTLVEYYVRALDGFEHYTYRPADYVQNPYSFRVLEPSRWDLDGDGEFGLGDLVEFVRTAVRGGADMLAGLNR